MQVPGKARLSTGESPRVGRIASFSRAYSVGGQTWVLDWVNQPEDSLVTFSIGGKSSGILLAKQGTPQGV